MQVFHKFLANYEPIKVEDPGPFDFRHARWGMSMEDVKKRESASLVGEDEESLLYTGLLDGQRVVITYVFVDDKLWRGVYSLDEKFSSEVKSTALFIIGGFNLQVQHPQG